MMPEIQSRYSTQAGTLLVCCPECKHVTHFIEALEISLTRIGHFKCGFCQQDIVITEVCHNGK